MTYNREVTRLTLLARKKWLLVEVAVIIVASALTLTGLSRGLGRKLSSSLVSPPSITWSQPQVNMTLPQGDLATKDITLASNSDLKNIVIETVPEIAPYISIRPATFANLAANQPRPVHISFAIPLGASLGTYEGTVHVRVENRTLPNTLRIVITVVSTDWRTLSDPRRGVSFMLPPTWTASSLGDELTVSNAPLDSEPSPDSLLGFCKIDFGKIEKPAGRHLREWLLDEMAVNGDPEPKSITPVVLRSLVGLRVVTGESAVIDTIYLPLSDTIILSAGLVCGEDIQPAGEFVFAQILSTVTLL
jgi:hypothetical protein